MGLDMYLERMPRYKGTTARKVAQVEKYLRYEEDCKNPKSHAKEYSMEEWCGVSENDVSKELLEFYKPFFTLKYYSWDIEKNYGHRSIIEMVADWRKANAIHQWFVDTVQDGEDDCQYHNEVTKEVLERLLDICERVLKASKLVAGPVINGYTYKDGMEVPNIEDGMYIANTDVAKELLPTTSGFFFGSTDYDEWYYNDIEYTVNVIKKVLKTTDFETQMIYYCSSW